MHSAFDKKRASVASSSSPNEKMRWQANVKMWQTVVDHHDQMLKHIACRTCEDGEYEYRRLNLDTGCLSRPRGRGAASAMLNRPSRIYEVSNIPETSC